MNQQEVMEQLAGRSPLPALTPRDVYMPDLAADIGDLPSSALVKAGLHLLNDDLGRAHVIAQTLEGDATADYWHAIIHRREGDYGNARYWFARTGPHPVLTEIHGDVGGADRFVESCRVARGKGDAALEELQWREMLRLLEFSSQGK